MNYEYVQTLQGEEETHKELEKQRQTAIEALQKMDCFLVVGLLNPENGLIDADARALISAPEELLPLLEALAIKAVSNCLKRAQAVPEAADPSTPKH